MNQAAKWSKHLPPKEQHNLSVTNNNVLKHDVRNAPVRLLYLGKQHKTTNKATLTAMKNMT
jgi:hypothetical protein